MNTWREDIIQSLIALGGAGAYEEIYAEIAARRADRPPSWKEVVRRTIQQASSDSTSFVPSSGDMFRSVEGIGTGTWALRQSAGGVATGSGIAEGSEYSQGYVVSSRVRKAIEIHAVSVAKAYYARSGADEIEELGKPYDLKVTSPTMERHVEVKGSLRSLRSVTLTKNEISHARVFPCTELFVVDEIDMLVAVDGAITMVGGRVRIWRDWSPADDSLVAQVFDHTLGTGEALRQASELRTTTS